MTWCNTFSAKRDNKQPIKNFLIAVSKSSLKDSLKEIGRSDGNVEAETISKAVVEYIGEDYEIEVN